MAPEDEIQACPVCQSMNLDDDGVCADCGFVAIVVDPESDESADADPAGDQEIPDDSPRSAPREGLLRSAPFEIASSDGLNFEGYAAVFNDPTIIDSWEGRFVETIERGAFAKTLSERTPVMMFDHGQHPMIGSMPIGSITRAAEDAHGVHVQGRLLDNWLISPVRDAIEAKAVDGMSFRMNVIKDSWRMGDDKMPNRSIKEVACPELGPVVFPAYANTTASVRSREALSLATSLADPEMRTEIARLLLAGTPADGAAMPTDEPDPSGHHSPRQAQLRRKALVAVALSERNRT